MPATPLLDYRIVQRLTTDQHFRVVWNALIPASAVETKVQPNGVAYHHATKGWKFVSAKRFAIRGVI